MKSIRLIRTLAPVVLALVAAQINAQTYPARPVRVVTPQPVGSGSDLAMRLVADYLSRTWSQPVIVENRTGASGFIAMGLLKSAAADGYTIAHASSSHLTTHPLLYKQLPYNPASDFEAVIPLFKNYFFIVVPTAAPWKNVADMIAAAKAKPGTLNYGSGFVGSPGHLGAAALEAATGTQMVHVPFKETSQLFASVGTGDIGWTLASPGTAGAAVSTGKVRLLAIAAPSRLPAYKDVPTVSESGGPANFEVVAWTGIVAPARTPAAIVEKINRDIARAVAEPDIRQRFTVFGYDPYIMSPRDMTRLMATETAQYAPIVKKLNVSLD